MFDATIYLAAAPAFGVMCGTALLFDGRHAGWVLLALSLSVWLAGEYITTV